jgi:hypothetical protein
MRRCKKDGGKNCDKNVKNIVDIEAAALKKK